jgi:hypothetical protein
MPVLTFGAEATVAKDEKPGTNRVKDVRWELAHIARPLKQQRPQPLMLQKKLDTVRMDAQTHERSFTPKPPTQPRPKPKPTKKK